MVQNQYQLKYIATATTTHVVTGTNNLTIHTIVCPIATAGTVTFQDVAANAYFVLPAGSIGSFLLDISLAAGLDVVTASGDKVIINYQTP